MNVHQCSQNSGTVSKEVSGWGAFLKALAPLVFVVAFLCWGLGLITTPAWEAHTAGVRPCLEVIARLTVADICEQLGVQPGALVLAPFAAGLVRTLRRCRHRCCGTGTESWLQRVVGRTLLLIRAWQASKAADRLMSELLLLATLHTSEWWWTLVAAWFYVRSSSRWPVENSVFPPSDEGHIVHVTLGAIQCGRFYARHVARCLPWLLPAAWLQPGCLPLMLYTAYYTVNFARLAIDLEPGCLTGLRSFFVIGEDRSLVPVLCYPLFWWAPFSLLSSLLQTVIQTPWPGWKYAPLLPWSFVSKMEGPGFLQLLAVLAAYPTWWKGAISMTSCNPFAPDYAGPLLNKFRAGERSSVLAAFLAGPGAQEEPYRVEGWALFYILLIFEEAKGPFALIGYILRSYPNTILPFLLHSLLGSAVLLPVKVFSLVWRPALVVVPHIQHNWPTARDYGTAGAQWFEAAAASVVVVMYMAISKAAVFGRAFLAYFMTAYTKRKHQQQRPRRRRICTALHLDDGFLHPLSDRASGRATTVRKASMRLARSTEAGKLTQDCKAARQLSTSHHAQQVERLPSPAAAVAPTVSAAPEPETSGPPRAKRTQEDYAARPSASEAPAFVRSQRRHSRHSMHPTRDRSSGSGSGSSSAHGGPPVVQPPATGSAAAASAHTSDASAMGATLPTSRPPRERRSTQQRQRQHLSPPQPEGTAEQIGRHRNRQASGDRAAANSRSRQAAQEPAAATSQFAVGTPVHLASPEVSELDSARTPPLSFPPAWVPTPDQKSQAASAGPPPAGSDEDSECVYCTERPPAALCIPCGHMVFCEPCAQLLYRRGRTACELCRVELEGWWGPTMGQLAVGAAPARKDATAPSWV